MFWTEEYEGMRGPWRAQVERRVPAHWHVPFTKRHGGRFWLSLLLRRNDGSNGD